MRELSLYLDCQSQMMETARSPRDASNHFLVCISYPPRRFESYNNDNFVYLFNNISAVQAVFSYIYSTMYSYCMFMYGYTD